MPENLTIAGRKSLLSRIQVYQVIYELKKIQPHLEFKTYFKDISSENQQKWDEKGKEWLNNEQFSRKGLFVAHLQEKLATHEIDAIVHSHKDVPYEKNPHGSYLGVLPRADQREVFFLKKKSVPLIIKKGEIFIGTSSPRRSMLLERNLSKLLPQKLSKSNIKIKNFTGNVHTRIEKFASSTLDGIILAKAGLDRLLDSSKDHMYPSSMQKELQIVRQKLYEHFKQFQFMVLPLALFPNAPAQGNLVVEIRKDAKEYLYQLFSHICHPSNLIADNERRFAEMYSPSCIAPLGVAYLDYQDFFKLYLAKGHELCLDNSSKIKQFPKNLNSQQKAALLSSKKETYSFIVSKNTYNSSFPQSLKNAWPMSPQEKQNVKIKRTPIPHSHKKQISDSRSVFIARLDAFRFMKKEKNQDKQMDVNQEFSLLYVPASGTWQKLAKKNIWVNASYNSLDPIPISSNHKFSGEESPLHTLRLSHENSGTFIPISINAEFKLFPTYRLHFTKLPNTQDIKEKKYFFWRSASLFQAMIQKHPHILEFYHSCMPGLTSEYIRQNIPNPEKLRVFLSYEDWLRSLK